MGRRVLVTGLGAFWGGRVAKALEADPSVEVIIGLDTREPQVELERTEYVRSDENYSILSRIVRATQVDTIVHTFLVVDSTSMRARAMHEINVIGTMNLFAAAADSSVRNVVVKSSSYVYGCHPRDPTWFTEDTPRHDPLRHQVERSLAEVESYVRDFAVDNPHVDVSLLRFSNVLGNDITTPLSRMLEAPVVPSVFGYDPRFQFVHENDVIRAVLFVLEQNLAGIYNVAGDGLLPWSEVAAICGKRTWPLPPVGQGLVGAALRVLGIDIPPEVVDLLSYGRGIDNSRLKELGFDYTHTSAGTVRAFIETLRLRRTVGEPQAYRYRQEVEDFFKRSPAVVRRD
ncbi:MAG: NAD-dependent epimerase/dehydratase family protein [Acidimicrobiales bacterium]|nr:NAD-dependent epimerase/dehydratase family protein [Acidimicrobiales bacterium]